MACRKLLTQTGNPSSRQRVAALPRLSDVNLLRDCWTDRLLRRTQFPDKGVFCSIAVTLLAWLHDDQTDPSRIFLLQRNDHL